LGGRKVVIIDANNIKNLFSSTGPGSWDQVEICEDGSIKLRVASLKIMESIVNLGFSPKRETDLTGRRYSPSSSSRPYKIQSNQGVKILTPLRVSKNIYTAFPGYRVGFILKQVPGITEDMSMIYPSYIYFFEKSDDDIQVEIIAVSGRRVTMDNFSEFARLYIVAIPFGFIPAATLEETIEQVDEPESIMVNTEQDIPDNVEDDDIDDSDEDIDNSGDEHESTEIVEDSGDDTMYEEDYEIEDGDDEQDDGIVVSDEEDTADDTLIQEDEDE
jgi:hypothetical protein